MNHSQGESEPLGEHNAGTFLAAYADHELDEGGQLAVLQYLSENPDATRRVLGQALLRHHARRCLLADAPVAPLGLKQRLQQLAAAIEANREGQAARDSSGPLGPITGDEGQSRTG